MVEEGCSYIEGSFMWAVEQMKQGKKVMRKKWRFTSCKSYLYIENKSPGTSRGTDQIFLSSKHWNTNKREDSQHFVALLDFVVTTDWEIYEENRFGSFQLIAGTNEIYNSNGLKVIHPSELNDLEKAIKRARELQCKKRL